MDLGNAGSQLVYVQDVSKLSDVLLQMAVPLLGWLPSATTANQGSILRDGVAYREHAIEEDE
jgi:hypothetical protein